ncbi:exported hypothetical protein [Syntrophobacter sp. SbD1]|nr:exported hypothetical protein [Syntrophobacter sp. SbD1]
MRKLLYTFLTVALFVISGCNPFGEGVLGTGYKAEGVEEQDIVELQGPQYAKLNSIGCSAPDDVQKAQSHDFDTIDKLIRDKRCFVIPTDKTIYIKERARGEIVSVYFKDTTNIFYTERSNLVPK